jgi:3',5'-cyclic AMP phosphodiesterase CpdA
MKRESLPALAILTAVLGIAAVLTPLWAGEPERVAGFCLLVGAAAEMVQGFRRSTRPAQRQAWIGAAWTLVLAVLLLNAPWLAISALVLFVSFPFLIDAVRHLVTAGRQMAGGGSARQPAVAALWNLAAGVTVLLVGRHAETWVAGLAAGLRLAQTTVGLAAAPVYSDREIDESVLADLFPSQPERLTETRDRLEREERERATADRDWIVALLVVLLTIHVSRMGFDRSALGILSPLVAVLGDIVFAFGLTYAVITPVRLSVRRATRRLERLGWERVLAEPSRRGPGRWLDVVLKRWLESRFRLSIRLRATRYSLRAAFGRGLQIGLPLTAIIVASVPIWGMSWYFDTENWAAGVWNSWAAQRTDAWREAMVRAAVAKGETTIDGSGFTVSPAGVTGGAPFSFVVIGDTGEGDASQHVLRDSLLRAAAAEDVKFVLISSDVVYPTGAMRDYELRFWLPFKGITKPVYAIPGNHDWYDALEAFVATFFQPEAARTAMRARLEADERVSSTTDATIESLIQRAAFLRGQYGVRTGFQQGPFFQIQTPEFALVAVDTGVLRRIDPAQLAWLRAALEASRGKMTFALLGHPLFAGGHDMAEGDEGFTAVRSVLREFGVRAVMAGDTHDLEYYTEEVGGAGGARTIHHWVNGGGGAYLSFGTALAWPAQAATAEWAHYPGRREVVDKIETETPWWKWPAWFWTRQFGAWPSSPEWLSAMFDYNTAPFFQSFVVVTVDPMARTLAVRPWGIRGRLAWKDFDRSAGMMPVGAAPEQLAEWVIQDPSTFR